jgi:hypothetical protein
MARRIVILVGCLSLLLTLSGCHYFLHHAHSHGYRHYDGGRHHHYDRGHHFRHYRRHS